MIVFKKALLWMMLLINIEANNYDFLVLESGQVVTNRGIFFNEYDVSSVLLDLSRSGVLIELKATYEQKTTIDNERIVLRDSVITNYITKVEIQYKLDKAKKKKAIIVTAIASALTTAGIILGLDVWISSKK